jgi:hypothetical protein
MTTAAKAIGSGGAGGTVHEARTGQRFPLRLPITISGDRSPRKHKATTTNVSAAGLYVRAERPLKVGSRITFEIMLPRQVLGTVRDVKIRCVGRVVRAESNGRVPRAKPAAAREKPHGMACVIDQYRFVRNSAE